MLNSDLINISKYTNRGTNFIELFVFYLQLPHVHFSITKDMHSAQYIIECSCTDLISGHTLLVKRVLVAVMTDQLTCHHLSSPSFCVCRWPYFTELAMLTSPSLVHWLNSSTTALVYLLKDSPSQKVSPLQINNS